MKIKKSLNSTIFVVLLLSSNAASSAEITRLTNSGIISINGEIRKGDAQKFRTLIREAIEVPGVKTIQVVLDSPGGNTAEAIEIGNAARSVLAKTVTKKSTVGLKSTQNMPARDMAFRQTLYLDAGEPLPELAKCWSACTFIFFGGAQRHAQYNIDFRTGTALISDGLPIIGVHRPRLSREYLARLSPSEAQEAHGTLLSQATNYLRTMGASENFIDRTLRTLPDDIDLISPNIFDEMYQSTEPFLEEWLIAKCGLETDLLTEGEKNLYFLYKDSLEEYLDSERYLQDINNRSSQSFARQIENVLVQKFGMRKALEMLNAVEKAEGWGLVVEFCKETVVRTHRHQWAIKQEE